MRIIGGRWRGRRLAVLDGDGLRPTPDRVRETLFNWLAPYIRGARALDLFAGTGALGIEALSRGASHACLVERERAVARQLHQSLKILGAQAQAQAQVVCGDALALLSAGTLGGRWDVVFVDPPYQHNCAAQVLSLLAQPDTLAPDALVYLESASVLDPTALAPTWQVLRAKAAGQVRYHLLARS